MNKNVLNHRLLSLLVSGACISLSAQAQNVTVSGRVQDTTGEPVAFATVMVPGSKAVTQTDANGNFKISVAAGADLRVSYIGYKTANVKANGKMVITLEDNSTLTKPLLLATVWHVKTTSPVRSLPSNPMKRTRVWWSMPRI